MQERWRLADDDFTRSKIFKIAQERYRGWRSTFSATYRAYKDNRETLLQNIPEELDLEEWEELISYFEGHDFQVKDQEGCLSTIWVCFCEDRIHLHISF